MSFEQLNRDELIALLNDLLERTDRVRREQQGSLDQQTQLVHELRVYQVELEMQNRELRDTQVELEQSRDRYAELYDFAPIAYFTLDERYVIRALNLKGAALFRSPREGLVGRSFVRLACAERPEALVELLKRAHETALGATGELALTIGGDPLYVQAMVSATMDPLTHATEFRCAMIDVTSRVRAERERDAAYAAERALHQRFESLDRINVALANILATHERTSVEAVLGAIAEHALSLLSAQCATVIVDGDAPLRVTRAAHAVDIDVPAPRQVLELRVPLRFAHRKLGQLSISYDEAHDVSLMEAQRTLELLAERAALAVQIARINSAEAEERARLALLEQAGRELAVCNDLASTEAALARTLSALVPDFASACMLFVFDGDAPRSLGVEHVDARSKRLLQRLSRVIGARLSVADPGQRAVAQHSLLELAGDERLARALKLGSVMVVPLSARKLRLGFLVLGTTATEQYSERLRETMEQFADCCASALDTAKLLEQLRTAVESRDTLLAIVSHDLRSPLNAILLTARSLAPRPPEQERRRSGAQVQLIQRSVARMGSLIDDLLTATQIDAGQFAVQPAAQRPSELIVEACMLNQPQCDAKELTIDHRCAIDLPEVWADRSRVLQVLTNLIGNAIKFTPSHGALRVTAELQAGQVRFGVSDTGPGIAAHELKRVFERYWTARSGRHGLGLGLFISERIVAAHGGRIWVESVPGKGASFYFCLPVASAKGRVSRVIALTRPADEPARPRSRV